MFREKSQINSAMGNGFFLGGMQECFSNLCNNPFSDHQVPLPNGLSVSNYVKDKGKHNSCHKKKLTFIFCVMGIKRLS